MYAETSPLNRLLGAGRLAVIVVSCLVLALSACSNRRVGPTTTSPQVGTLPGSLDIQPLPGYVGPQPNKVALLLPITGPSQAIGQMMENAAQLALFDVADDSFELVVRDTGGTPEGARQAARQAMIDGASLVLGPLFASSVRAVAPETQVLGINIVTFSNDRTVAGPGVFVMGLSPNDQVERVVDFAKFQGLQRFGVIASNTPYGQAVVQATSNAVTRGGGFLTRAQFFERGSPDLSPEVREFARGRDFDAVMVPSGGGELQQLVATMAYFDIDPNRVQYLGTVLWERSAGLQEPALLGGWIAAPDPVPWRAFSQKYEQAFGVKPSRIASLAYDAVAMAAALGRGSRAGAYSSAALANSNGFAGANGIFRFLPDGTSQRGLAVMQWSGNDFSVIDPAPRSFQPLIN